MNIQELTLADISHAYSGKANHCCCGCCGKHAFNSLHVEETTKSHGYSTAPDVDDKAVLKILRKIQSADDEQLDLDGDYVAADIGKKQYIAYLSEKFLQKV